MIGSVYLRMLRLERWTRMRFTPLGRTLFSGLIAVGLFSLNPRATLAYQLAALMFAVLLGAMLWAPLFRARVRAWRRLPRYATAGVPFAYTLEIENGARRALGELEAVDEPAAVTAHEAIVQARALVPAHRRWWGRRVGYMGFVRALRLLEGVHGTPISVPRLAAGERTRVRMTLTPTRRGYLRLGRLRLMRSDPLWVFRALVRIPLADRLLVLPRRYPVSWNGSGGALRRAQRGRSRARNTGAGTDFARLREYRPRDSMRHIHWRAWARLGEPVVKEFHEDSPSRNALVFDTRAPAQCVRETFEEAVSVAASFVTDSGWRSGRLDVLIAADSAVRLGQQGDAEGLNRMLELLACVQRAAPGAPAMAPETVLARIGECEACVLVLLDFDMRCQALVRALQRARVATLVLVVASDAVQLVRGGLGGVLDASCVHALVPGTAAQVLTNLHAGAPPTRHSAVA
jgi:uncharacterized protein (DUF58 family)